MELKTFDSNERFQLLCNITDIHSQINVLFLGKNFDVKKNEKILGLRWNTVITSITNEADLEYLSEKLENSKRKVNNIENSVLKNYLNSGKNELVDICNLTLIHLFDSEYSNKKRNKHYAEAKKTMRLFVDRYLKNYGKIFFLGYGKDDLLDLEDLVDILYESLGDLRNDELAYFFDLDVASAEAVSRRLKDIYEDAADTVFTLTGDSLGDLLNDLIEGDADDYGEDDYEQHTIPIKFFINGETVVIPEEDTREIRPFAELLDFEKLNPAPRERHRYRLWFASFLQHDMNTPKWYGYKEKFVLKRDFHEKLYKAVKKALDNPGDINLPPILLHGQSGSGKTIAIGQLAYSIFHERQYPVVYITNPHVKFFNDDDNLNNENNTTIFFEKLKTFLQYILNNKRAKSILLIWDCSGNNKERNDYIRLFRKLRDYGVNLVLVGTSYQYSIFKKKNVFEEIEAKIEINSTDIANLDVLLKNKACMDVKERNFILGRLRRDIKDNKPYANNFLVMLYNIFWNIKGDLENGIHREFVATINNLSDQSDYDWKYTEIGHIRIKNFETYTALVDKIRGSSDNDELISEFTKLTAFLTYYNKEVSGNLACNILKTNIKLIQKVLNAPMFHIHSYASGFETYSVRTRFEAELLLNSFGINIKTDYKIVASYLCNLLYKIKMEGIAIGASERDLIENITRIISEIGPNGNGNDTKWPDHKFEFYAPCFIKALHDAGSSVKTEPSLIVQELSLTREYCKYKESNKNEFKPISYKEFYDFFEKIYSKDDMEEYSFPEDDENYCGYEPDLKEKIYYGKQYLSNQENIEIEYKSTFDQIKVEITNGLILLDSLLSDGHSNFAADAVDYCEKVISKSKWNNCSSYAVTAWLKAHNILLNKQPEMDIEAAEKIIAFAINALQYNPDLEDDYYFVKQYKDALEYISNINEDTINKLASIMSIKPNATLIFCWAYSRLWKSNVIYENGDSICWSCVDRINHDAQYNTIKSILEEMDNYAEILEKDTRCLYLKLQLYWLLNNGIPINFKNEKQHTYLKPENWVVIGSICKDIIKNSSITDKMYCSHCKYILAISQIQIEEYESGIILLREIKDDLNYMKVYTKHLICDENGIPKLFAGINIKIDEHNNSKCSMDMISESKKKIANIYFNRFNITANSAVVLENGNHLDNLMMGVGFMGINALRNKKSEGEIK